MRVCHARGSPARICWTSRRSLSLGMPSSYPPPTSLANGNPPSRDLLFLLTVIAWIGPEGAYSMLVLRAKTRLPGDRRRRPFQPLRRDDGEARNAVSPVPRPTPRSDSVAKPSRRTQRSGFTLIELLVVIAIIAILIGL